jgi:hypothetical protein
MDSSCTNCTRLLLKIGKVSGFLFHDRLRSCSTSSNSLELPGFLDELVAYPKRHITFYTWVLPNILTSCKIDGCWRMNWVNRIRPLLSTTPLLHWIFLAKTWKNSTIFFQMTRSRKRIPLIMTFRSLKMSKMFRIWSRHIEIGHI